MTTVAHASLIPAVLAAAALAGCASPQPQVRDIDTQADGALRQMCDALDAAKSFRFHVDAYIDRPVATGQLAQFHRASEISVVRPDRLYAETASDDGNWSMWYLGGSLTVLDRDAKRYATESISGGIAEMLDDLADKHDLIVPAGDLLVGKTYESLLANVESGAYLGLHWVGEAECHHLLFRQANINWQIWIDTASPPVPRKLVITYMQEPDHPQYVAVMDDWHLAPSIPESTFAFLSPAGAMRATMYALLAQR